MSHLISILILAFGFAAHAEEGVSSLKLPELGESSTTTAPREGLLEIQLLQNDYISSYEPYYRGNATSSDTDLILRVDRQFGRERTIFFKIKGKDEYSQAENWNYGDVHELFVSHQGESSQISLGRKLETWASWDSDWKLGIFQPRYLENRLHSEEAGLTGLFLNAHSEHVSATLGLLPVFLPDFGPHFYAREGSLYSANPWFRPPSDRYVVNLGTGNIRYRIDAPQATDVVEHPGAAGKVEFHNEGFTTRVSAAYKPLANFLLAFPSNHRGILENSTDYFDIAIIPRVVYDRVVSLENLYHSDAWNFSAGIAHDQPDDNGGHPDWTSQQVSPATIFSAAIERRLLGQAAGVRIGFLKVSGGDAPDRGAFAGGETLFERRFQYYEAYLLGLKKNFVSSGLRYPLTTDLSVVYDRRQQGASLVFATGTNLTPNWRAEFQAEFLGLVANSADIADGFYATYRATDRLGLGISYVF